MIKFIMKRASLGSKTIGIGLSQAQIQDLADGAALHVKVQNIFDILSISLKARDDIFLFRDTDEEAIMRYLKCKPHSLTEVLFHDLRE